MNTNQFNNEVGGLINRAMKEGVAKRQMTTVDVAGVLTGAATEVLRAIGQAIRDADKVQAQAGELTNIIIPLKPNERKKPQG
jgi:hypothetical protein